MSCQHVPKFTIKNLIARKPRYICQKCGVELEMTQMTHSINRSMNAVLVGALFFKVLGNSSTGSGWVKMAIDLGVMLSFIAVYIVAYYFLIRFGKYTEKEVVEAPAENAESVVAAITKPSADETALVDGKMTQEQLDLMKLYESYAEKADSDPSTVPATLSSEPILHEPQTHVHTEACVHVPVKSWKIYIPTYMNFTCAKCGEPITFAAATKKSMNVAIMGVVLLILMPSFMNDDVGPLEYFGLTVLAFAVASIIQTLYLYKGKFEKHTVLNSKRR